MTYTSIKALCTQAAIEATQASVLAQLTQSKLKTTKQGKPFLELSFTDSSGSIKLNIWDNDPNYEALAELPPESCLCLSATWLQNEYGMNAHYLKARSLEESEREQLFCADEQLRAKQEKDWSIILSSIESMSEPRLQALCRLLLAEQGDRYRRSAAARNYHHARRGGLVEHVSGMLRSIDGLCLAYPELHRDLLIAGAIFHDCGKMWENNYPETSFAMPYTEVGELLGHIPIGIEYINTLWARMSKSEEATQWAQLKPSNQEVKLHLLHLIASHHGEIAFGSPVVPKTPEAHILHFVENIDAKMEMMRDCYASSAQLGNKIFARRMPLNGNAVSPLPPTADSP